MQADIRILNWHVGMLPFWLNFVALTVAEVLTVFFQLMAGIMLHGLLLVLFIMQAALTHEPARRNLYMCLVLAPPISLWRLPSEAPTNSLVVSMPMSS